MGKNRVVFWIFGILQAVALGFIVFFMLKGLMMLQFETQLALSIAFPLFLLLTEAVIYYNIK